MSETNGNVISLHGENEFLLDGVAVIKCHNYNPLHVAAARGLQELYEKLKARLQATAIQKKKKGLQASNRELVEALDLLFNKYHQDRQHVAAAASGGEQVAKPPKSGEQELFQKLLTSNPELGEALDSQQRSILHLATANGHTEIVKAIIEVKPDMCLARDRDGANPLHVAAMKGKVEILEELLKANPHAARARVDRGERETILHLCVKYDQEQCLEKLLIGCFEGDDFVNAKDDAGNTILHLAVAGHKIEIVKCVLSHKEINVNATNSSKQTAMDIIRLGRREGTKAKRWFAIKSIKRRFAIKDNCFGGGNGTNAEGSFHHTKEREDIKDLLRKANAQRGKDTIDGEWIGIAETRNGIIIVAVLMATIAFQAGVTPPGGVWQDNHDGHIGGEAVMAFNYPKLYEYFLRSNTIGFVASLSTILLIISELPFKKRPFMWILVMVMCLTITSMAFTYVFSIIVITPKWERKTLSRTIAVAIIAWSGVIAVLLLGHAVHLILKLVDAEKKKRGAVKRIKDNDKPRRDHTSTGNGVEMHDMSHGTQAGPGDGRSSVNGQRGDA
ncbi:hypothetical protein Vadar_023150 [Vaccinium darrowii]|uniref:Uncharacterized protein n=1 Tax=Vaccinium darrowii TaxID=229202 RepID=A0ACB7XC40_9ERIC|nr:hypothetical protein Vadar_023150 [Vaccinium darrowii]